MKKWLTMACLLLASAAHAQTNPLAGTFGHGSTSKLDDPVWTVRVVAGQAQLYAHGSKTMAKGVLMTGQQRKQLWDHLDFASESFQQAECIEADGEYVCYVPKKSRARDTLLKSQKSDFFHFDKVGGLMEIHKIRGFK